MPQNIEWLSIRNDLHKGIMILPSVDGNGEALDEPKALMLILAKML